MRVHISQGAVMLIPESSNPSVSGMPLDIPDTADLSLLYSNVLSSAPDSNQNNSTAENSVHRRRISALQQRTTLTTRLDPTLHHHRERHPQLTQLRSTVTYYLSTRLHPYPQHHRDTTMTPPDLLFRCCSDSSAGRLNSGKKNHFASETPFQPLNKQVRKKEVVYTIMHHRLGRRRNRKTRKGNGKAKRSRWSGIRNTDHRACRRSTRRCRLDGNFSRRSFREEC
jgi:hypothetical protein